MATATDQHFAERKLDALLTAWEAAHDPADPKWRGLWAAAEIAAGLPCFETRQNERGEWYQIDAGADGWRQWAGDFNLSFTRWA